MFALRFATALFFVAIVAGCGVRAVPPGADSPALLSDATGACTGQTPPPTPTPGARRGAIVVKVPLHGLVDLGQVSAVNMPEPPANTLYYVCQRASAISGIVVNDTWQTLQPRRGAAIDTSSIDAALEAIAAYNAASKHPLGVRLRVWAGIDAPNWAKAIGGPIVICDQNAVPTPSPTPAGEQPASQAPTPCPSPAQRTVGAFWSPAYESAWRNLQAQLAKKYDGDLAVSEVTVSSCSSLTSEPFVQPEDGFSKTALIDAHYSDDAYKACLAHAIARDYAPYWHVTGVPFSFNPFREIDLTPPQSDLAFTERVIDGCRAAIGPRCVLQNEALAKYTPPPSPAPGATPSVAMTYYLMWSYMHGKGGDVTFQSASPPNLYNAWGSNIAGWNAAVRLAHEFGASSLELFPQERYQPECGVVTVWYSGYTCFTLRTMLRWAATIRS